MFVKDKIKVSFQLTVKSTRLSEQQLCLIYRVLRFGASPYSTYNFDFMQYAAQTLPLPVQVLCSRTCVTLPSFQLQQQLRHYA